MSAKPDALIFMGPVILKEQHRAVAWPHPMEVRVLEGAGSSTFRAMGQGLRDSDGRVLPALLRRVFGSSARREDFRNLVIASYSAGYGLVNELGMDERDRSEVNALVMSDSAFGNNLDGVARFAADATCGRLLMVMTTSNNLGNPSSPFTARDAVQIVIQDAYDDHGACGWSSLADRVMVGAPNAHPKSGMSQPSGGVYHAGDFWLYHYAEHMAPPNTGNDMTHGDHHDYAPVVWQSHVVPYLQGGWPLSTIAGVGLLAAAGAGAAYIIWSAS